jgi:hypothetical protein
MEQNVRFQNGPVPNLNADCEVNFWIRCLFNCKHSQELSATGLDPSVRTANIYETHP